MREIDVREISDCICNLCVETNDILPQSLQNRLEQFMCEERNPLAKSVLCDLCRNLDVAKELGVAICQDTGMAVVFLEIGQDVHLIGGDLREAVDAGVAAGYKKGYLRCSVVRDPIRRGNTGDNTPAILHTTIVPGEQVTITVAPKGFGSENMSATRMLNPSASREEVMAAVVEIVRLAGGNPCPPMVVGVGIGGDFELAAYLAKKALCRDVDAPHPDSYYAEMERELLQQINELGIGPQGFGGDTTALAVNIETYPTHIAGLPMAVNIGCHVTRHKTVTL